MFQCIDCFQKSNCEKFCGNPPEELLNRKVNRKEENKGDEDEKGDEFNPPF